MIKFSKLGVFWNPEDLLLMRGTEIFKIDASWAEKLMKTRVSKIIAPTVDKQLASKNVFIMHQK